MRVLVIRMMGLGDVACIGLPGLRMLRRLHPEAAFSFMTFAVGGEILQLESGLEHLYVVPPQDWPKDFSAASRSFFDWGKLLAAEKFDLIYNLDTWFMPCFLARLLLDGGSPVRGNYIRWPVKQFLELARAPGFDSSLLSQTPFFMASTFPGMAHWNTLPWWKVFPCAEGYPRFYLSHCCGLEGPWDMRVAIPPDTDFRAAANGRPLLCLATNARKKERTYKRNEELRAALEQAGFCVWTQETLPVRQSLARLSVSALILTVPSAPQWLARLVGCPVVLIPGPSAPEHLAPDAFVPRHLECQTGVFDRCSTCLDYACMDAAPGTVVEVTLAFYKTLLKPGRPSDAPPAQ